MIKLLFVSLLLVTMISMCHGKDDEGPQRNIYKRVALDYFMTRRIQNVIMFLCWPEYDIADIIALFSKHNIRVSFGFGKHKKRNIDIENLFRMYTNKLGGVFDSCCYDERTPFMQKYTYFNSTYVWLIFDSGSFQRSLNYLKTLSLSITTDLVMTNTSTDLTELDLYDIYHTGYERGGQFCAVHFGKWYPSDDDSESGNQEWKNYFQNSKVYRRFDLNGLEMRAVTLTENNKRHIDTHTYLMDDLHPHTDSISKMNYQMVRILQKMYNFTIKFVLANNWSDKNSKGFYQSGNLIGLLGDKKADLMAAAVQLMWDRVKITDVLYMTYPFRCGFIFRYLGDFGDVRTSFYAPFNNTVWYCFLTTIVVVIAVIWLILSFENKYVKDINKTLWNFSDTILSVIGACCQMGSQVTPVTSASRIVYFIFFFTSLIIYNFYTSSIVSTLLNFRSQTFNIIDLSDSPLTCGSIDVGYVHNLLFDIPVYPHMDYFNARKKTSTNFYFPVEEGIAKVKKGGFAYNAEFNSVYKLIENTFEATEICELQEIDTIPGNKLAILGLKYSPYTEMFKVGLTKAAETGQLKRLLLKWVSRKPACQASKSFTEVGLNQIVSSHMLLYVGIALSIAVVLLERKRYKMMHTEEKDIFKIKRPKKREMLKRYLRNHVYKKKN